MKKKHIRILLCSLLCAVLIGTGLYLAFLSQNAMVCDSYSIYEKDGKSYISMHKEDWTEYNSHTIGTLNAFSTVEKMQNHYLSGNGYPSLYFNQDDVDAADSLMSREICDLRCVYDATCPDDTVISAVKFNFWYYTFHFTSVPIRGEMRTTGRIEGWVDTYQRYYDNPETLTDKLYTTSLTLKSVKNIADRNAKEVIFEGDNGFAVYRLYTVYGQHGAVHVIELHGYYKDPSNKESVPYYITLYGEDQGADYMCTFSEMKERPSTTWLASFGLNFRLDLWKPFAY